MDTTQFSVEKSQRLKSFFAVKKSKRFFPDYNGKCPFGHSIDMFAAYLYNNNKKPRISRSKDVKVSWSW